MSLLHSGFCCRPLVRRIILALALPLAVSAEVPPLPVNPDLVVAADGSGDFKSVFAAVQSIRRDNRERRVILVRNGIYREKVRIDAADVTLRGESRAGARIEFPWAAAQGRDDRGLAVININGDDCVLENLTIENTDGQVGRHAFAIYGRGDRTVIQDCDVLSRGNDTLSLWRTGSGQFSEDASTHASANGRYYQARLKVCGSVDFICPRGWCYMVDSELTEVSNAAAMWHDGSRDRDMKFVMVRCRFDGQQEFPLARHHHDAMFFFVDCSFPKTMRDSAPHRVVYPLSGGEATEADRKRNHELDASNVWGERAYYFNSHRDGGDYAWHRDNLTSAPGAPTRDQITAKWTFGGSWDPERTDAPRIVSVSRDGKTARTILTFSEPVTVKGKPRLVFSNGEATECVDGNGSSALVFAAPAREPRAAASHLELHSGAIVATLASSTLRRADIRF